MCVYVCIVLDSCVRTIVNIHTHCFKESFFFVCLDETKEPRVFMWPLFGPFLQFNPNCLHMYVYELSNILALFRAQSICDGLFVVIKLLEYPAWISKRKKCSFHTWHHSGVYIFLFVRPCDWFALKTIELQPFWLNTLVKRILWLRRIR